MNWEWTRKPTAYVATRTRSIATVGGTVVVREWKRLRTAGPVVQKTVYAACLIAAAVVLLWLVLGPFTRWATPVDGLKGKELADVRTATRQTLLAAIGGLAVLVGLAFTGRTYYLSRRGQLTDRYGRAITQLASEKLTERLGGIYALEHLMLESERDHETVVDVLAVFARESAPVTRSLSPDDAEDQSGAKRPPPRPATDVQAALTVLARRPIRPERNPIDLAGTDMSRAKLRRANLWGAHLSHANLREANLWYANLQGAYLGDANLQGAYLGEANLREAILYSANLQRANLSADLRDANLDGTNLRGAHLDGANLQSASLEEADLQYASLRSANLQGAYLGCADLQGAHLDGANLQGAHLEEADLQGAYLEGANLQGAYLEGANLQGARLETAAVMVEQLIETNVTESTQLPAAVRAALDAESTQLPAAVWAVRTVWAVRAARDARRSSQSAGSAPATESW